MVSAEIAVLPIYPDNPDPLHEELPSPIYMHEAVETLTPASAGEAYFV